MTASLSPTPGDVQITELDAAGAAAEAICDVCGHPHRVHGTVGVRWCGASRTNALTRGCLCSV